MCARVCMVYACARARVYVRVIAYVPSGARKHACVLACVCICLLLRRRVRARTYVFMSMHARQRVQVCVCL